MANTGPQPRTAAAGRRRRRRGRLSPAGYAGGGLCFYYSFCCFLSLVLLTTSTTPLVKAVFTAELRQLISPIRSIQYGSQNASEPMVLEMRQMRIVPIKVSYNSDLLNSIKNLQKLELEFVAETISPRIVNLKLFKPASRFAITKSELEKTKYTQEFNVTLATTYIGHAVLTPVSITYTTKPNASDFTLSSGPIPLNNPQRLHLTIVQYEGVWGLIFIVSVSVFIIITYINLGAQLDMDNMAQLVKNPTTVVLGLLVGLLLMPMVSFWAGQLLFRGQELYKLGSFVFACCPSASASTLWTVMLDANKEFAVSLQILSTIVAIFAMPLLLYFYELFQPQIQSSDGTANAVVQVPYGKLVQSLAVLLVAMLVGWQLTQRYKMVKVWSAKILRPLTIFVLLFIIIFSSIIYWYIYLMFEVFIVVQSLVVIIATAGISSLLGYLVSSKYDYTVPIAIASTYKNSGIAFAILLLAFGSPDVYIAFVPSLLQVLVTSALFYLVYGCLRLKEQVARRNQPDGIQAEQPANVGKETQGARKASGDSGASGKQSRTKRSGSADDKSDQSDEHEEFIAMDVTDLVAQHQASPPKVAATNTVDKKPIANEARPPTDKRPEP